MKGLFAILFVFSIFCGYSQVNLNEYKYIIVPKRFEAFKNENQFKTSTLVKYLFHQNGFNTLYDDVFPDDLSSNRCLGLYVSLNDDSTMFSTKVSLVLKDCSSNEILSTMTGNSKVKEYEGAYREAITEAFGTIRALDYKYLPKKENQEPVTISFKNDIKTLEKKREPKNKVDEAVVKQVATPEEQVYKSNEPVASNIEKAEQVSKEVVVNDKTEKSILYAQEIPNGFQLVDNTPKIRLKLFRTSIPDVYMVKDDNGVVYKKDGKWYYNHYIGDTLKTEELNIKF